MLLLMFVFLIHLLHPMQPVPYQLAIRSMTTQRREHMDKRIREIEHASLTPVVMSATGGLAHEATYFYKSLASLLSHKWGDEYSIVMGWLRCSLSFFVMLSYSVCLWGPLLDSTLY